MGTEAMPDENTSPTRRKGCVAALPGWGGQVSMIGLNTYPMRRNNDENWTLP